MAWPLWKELEEYNSQLITGIFLCAVVSHLVVSDSEILWTVAHQVPLSMGFSRQEYWSALPCSPPADLSDPRIKPTPLMSPALAGRFFTSSATWEDLEFPWSGWNSPQERALHLLRCAGRYLVKTSLFCALKQDRDKLGLKTFKGKC